MDGLTTQSIKLVLTTQNNNSTKYQDTQAQTHKNNTK